MQRERWATRSGFLFAAIGAAVGLGNIWRFPYVAYENGGGAFLFPYVIALLSAGLPLLILEYTVGRKFRGSPPLAFARMRRSSESVGWWQVLISCAIPLYYAVIIAWALRYVGFSLGTQWGSDPDGFFYRTFLQSGESPAAPLRLVLGVLWPLLIIWGLTLAVLLLGVRRGIERANKIIIPLLVVVFGALVLRAVSLPGAAEGLKVFFTPDVEALTHGSTWLAAYGQIFFSLSVGFGTMLTYASYLDDKSDLTGSALIAGSSNAAFELCAGVGVFSALGFMASAQSVAVQDVATDGIGLAFVAFPQVISEISLGSSLFGVLFFGSLVMAGLSSLISIVQVPVAAAQEKFGLSRRSAVWGVGGVLAVLSVLLFPTTHGLMLLNVVDHFVNGYAIVFSGLLMLISVIWFSRDLGELQRHANLTSRIQLGAGWGATLAVITPLVLTWMLIDSALEEFAAPYDGFPLWYLLLAGWSVLGVMVVLSVVNAVLPWRGNRVTAPHRA